MHRRSVVRAAACMTPTPKLRQPRSLQENPAPGPALLCLASPSKHRAHPHLVVVLQGPTSGGQGTARKYAIIMRRRCWRYCAMCVTWLAGQQSSWWGQFARKHHYPCLEIGWQTLPTMHRPDSPWRSRRSIKLLRRFLRSRTSSTNPSATLSAASHACMSPALPCVAL